jgi:hypothetical protein
MSETMTPLIKGHFILGYGDQLRAVWAQSRLLRIVVLVLPVLFVSQAMVQVLDGLIGVERLSLQSLGLLLMVTGLWPAVVLFGVWRLSPQQKNLTYLIDADRVLLRDGAGNALSAPWHEVRALREDRAGFVLSIGLSGLTGGRWIARRAFAPESLHALRSLARQKLGAKARLLS